MSVSAGLSFRLDLPDGTIAIVCRGQLVRVTYEGERPQGWQKSSGDSWVKPRFSQSAPRSKLGAGIGLNRHRGESRRGIAR